MELIPILSNMPDYRAYWRILKPFSTKSKFEKP